MANSILELAAEAASSTLFIFCLFNLLILIILFASKPVSSSSFDQQDDDNDMPLSIVIHSNTNTTEQLQKNPKVDVCEVTEIQNEIQKCTNFNCNDNVEHSDDDDHEDADEDEDEDEFRRRVEEFIEKVNRGWREERQGTSRPVES